MSRCWKAWRRRCLNFNTTSTITDSHQKPPQSLPSTRIMTSAAEERELLLNPVVPENVAHNTKVHTPLGPVAPALSLTARSADNHRHPLGDVFSVWRRGRHPRTRVVLGLHLLPRGIVSGQRVDGVYGRGRTAVAVFQERERAVDDGGAQREQFGEFYLDVDAVFRAATSVGGCVCGGGGVCRAWGIGSGVLGIYREWNGMEWKRQEGRRGGGE